jgi:glycosyltransferase involved in cell wall biosynthesis
MKNRVLHLIDSAGLYGAEKVVLALLQQFKSADFPGILGCIRETDKEYPEIGRKATELGIQVAYFTMQKGLNPVGIYRIQKFIREEAIDVVHSHGYKSDIFSRLLRKQGLSKVATVHGWAKGSASIRVKSYEFFDGLALRSMRRVVAVSDGVKKDLANKGVKTNRIQVIHNGIETQKNYLKTDSAELRKTFSVSEGDFVIGSVGRLAEVKGHSFLIEAMPSILREIPNCKLLLAGEGPLRSKLEELINHLTLADKVKLLGYTADIDGFLALIDLFVLPSFSEGLPIALLEAMAFGKPFAVSAVGGILEVIDKSTMSMVISPGNSESIATVLKDIIRNADVRNRLAHVGPELLKDKFSMSTMVEGYRSMYNDICENSAKHHL